MVAVAVVAGNPYGMQRTVREGRFFIAPASGPCPRKQPRDGRGISAHGSENVGQIAEASDQRIAIAAQGELYVRVEHFSGDPGKLRVCH